MLRLAHRLSTQHNPPQATIHPAQADFGIDLRVAEKLLHGMLVRCLDLP
ncbi:hypothetical protein [Sapientia aquatica]|nr:hypothetical protein [Sapientia aquatica]